MTNGTLADLAAGLIDTALDALPPTDRDGADGAIRAAVRAVLNALTAEFDGCADAASGAIRIALDEIAYGLTDEC